MRHVAFDRYGGPEVLTLREAPGLVPGPDDVTIAVRAAGVNFADVMARMGLYPDAPKPPLVPGYEVSGTIDRVGPSVSHLKPGDRVVALTRFGGYASHVLVPSAYAFPIPDDVTDHDAAALPVNYLTASLALYRAANLTSRDTVLIHGAGGGVGIAATQLARLRHATVIGTAAPAKHDAIRALGVAHAIDSRTVHGDALVREVRQLTNGRGADVILDPIGGTSFETSYRLLAPLGRLVIYGVSAVAPGKRRNLWRALRAVMQIPRFKPMSMMNRNRGVFGLNLAHLWDEQEQLAAEMQPLLADLRAGRIRPVVGRTFPLGQAADAHDYLQSRQNVGKVLLTL